MTAAAGGDSRRSRQCRCPLVDRANRLLRRIERREHLVPLAPMRSSVEFLLRLQELLRGTQVLWRSRGRVESARGGERQAIQPCGKDNVKVFGPLVVRKITSWRQHRNFEITFDLAESTEFFNRRHRSLLAPDQ